ncbi:hypothetical protein VQL36_10195 [Chengkuizengella sp. SCS-71B]
MLTPVPNAIPPPTTAITGAPKPTATAAPPTTIPVPKVVIPAAYHRSLPS